MGAGRSVESVRRATPAASQPADRSDVAAFSGYGEALSSPGSIVSEAKPEDMHACSFRRRSRDWRANEVAELSGRRLRHKKLYVPERRDRARTKPPLSHPWN